MYKCSVVRESAFSQNTSQVSWTLEVFLLNFDSVAAADPGFPMGARDVNPII